MLVFFVRTLFSLSLFGFSSCALAGTPLQTQSISPSAFVPKQSNSGITFQGRLAKPDGTVVKDPSASFVVEIWGESDLRSDRTAVADACLLFSETHNNVEIRGGKFAFAINGDNTTAVFGAGLDKTYFPKLFINPPHDLTAFDTIGYSIPAISCSSGQKYFLPNLATNTRLIKAKAILSDGIEIDLGTMMMQSAPFALQTKEISGFSAADLFKVGVVSVPTANILSQNQANLLMNLFNENSNTFDFQNKRVTGVRTPQISELNAAANVAYVNTQLANFSVTGLVTGTPNQIQVTPAGNSVAISLAPINPAPGSFGASDKVQTLTIDSFGRVTSVANTAISINANQVTAGTLGLAQGGTGFSNIAPNRLIMSNAGGTALQADTCTNNGQILQFNGTKWVCVDGGIPSANGTVTSVAGVPGQIVISQDAAVNPMVGLAASGVVAGTYTKVQVDIYGRVILGSNIVATDVPDLAGEVSGPILNTLIGNNVVTYGKMQKVANNNALLGRYQGANGDVQEITVGPGLSISPAGVLSSIGAQAWVTGGNALTNPATETLGTKNNQPLNIVTNNVVRATVDTAGRVGIGTATPRAALDVNGVILGKPAVANATSIIDFATGNSQFTNNLCGAFDLHNMKDGGSYTFVVFGTTGIPPLPTCSFNIFTDAGVTQLPPANVRLPPDHGPTWAFKYTIYNIAIVGNTALIAWMPGM